MKFKLPAPQRPTPTNIGEQNSEIGVMASHIRQAAEYLMKDCGYSIKHLENLTGGSTKDGIGGRKKERMHKNSILKIKDLRIAWTVLKPLRAKEGAAYEAAVAAAEAAGVKLDPSIKMPRLQWAEGLKRQRGFMNSPGREQWLWNPQVDSFEKLERILVEAKRLGFVPQPPRPPARKNGTHSATAPAKPAETADTIADPAPDNPAGPEPAVISAELVPAAS